MNDPFGVKGSVFHSGHQGIPEQVIHPIGVELAGYDVPEKADRKSPVDHGPDFVRLDFVVLQDGADFGLLTSDDLGCPGFMGRGRWECSFEHVGERPMPGIVKQGRGLDSAFVFADQPGDFRVVRVATL